MSNQWSSEHQLPDRQPSTTVVTETTAGQASAVGTALTFAPGDHTHGTPANPSAATIGAVSTAGGSVIVSSGTGVVSLIMQLLTGQTADRLTFKNVNGSAQTQFLANGNILHQGSMYVVLTLQVGTSGDTNGGGVGGVAIADAATLPGSTPSGGGFLYSQAGALKWKGSSGTITPIAPA